MRTRGFSLLEAQVALAIFTAVLVAGVVLLHQVVVGHLDTFPSAQAQRLHQTLLATRVSRLAAQAQKVLAYENADALGQSAQPSLPVSFPANNCLSNPATWSAQDPAAYLSSPPLTADDLSAGQPVPRLSLLLIAQQRITAYLLVTQGAETYEVSLFEADHGTLYRTYRISAAVSDADTPAITAPAPGVLRLTLPDPNFSLLRLRNNTRTTALRQTLTIDLHAP